MDKEFIDGLDKILSELRNENADLKNELIDLKLFIVKEINLAQTLKTELGEETAYLSGFLNGLNLILQKL